MPVRRGLWWTQHFYVHYHGMLSLCLSLTHSISISLSLSLSRWWVLTPWLSVTDCWLSLSCFYTGSCKNFTKVFLLVLVGSTLPCCVHPCFSLSLSLSLLMVGSHSMAKCYRLLTLTLLLSHRDLQEFHTRLFTGAGRVHTTLLCTPVFLSLSLSLSLSLYLSFSLDGG
jgi:hypothetical protein